MSKIKLDGVSDAYFHITDAGKDWHIECRKCGQRWALAKTSEAVGNRLFLLNHARSHDAPERRARRNK